MLTPSPQSRAQSRTENQGFFSSIFKNFCIAAAGLLGARLVTVLSVPLILLFIPPADYGIWGLITSFIYLLTLCTNIGLRQMLAIEYFHINSHEQKKLVTSILTLYACITLLCYTLLFINFSRINTVLFFNKLSWPLFSLMLVCSFLYLYNDLFMQLIKYSRQAQVFTALTLVQALITASTTLLFIYFFKWSVQGMLMGLCLGLLSTFLYAIYTYLQAGYHRYISVPSYESFMYMKKSSIFLPGLIAGWILTSHASWLLASHTSLAHVGIYSFAARCSYFCELIIIQALNCSYIPTMLSRLHISTNKKQLEFTNKKAMYTCMALMLVCISLLAIGARPLLQHLVPACYCEHLSCLWLMLIGSVFLMGSYFTFILIQFYKQTKALALVSFIPAVISIIGNRLLIPHFGIYGCAVTYALAYTVYFGMSLAYNYWLINKTHM